MGRARVFDVLGVTLDGLPVIATGPTTELTTIYLLDASKALYLTWDARRPDAMVLLRAYVLAR
jgi:hypothetical protein